MEEYRSKHSGRDLLLPNLREKLLDYALSDLTSDPDVLGIYLAGSLAKGNFDIYSDIDLHTIVTPKQKSKFIQEKRTRPTKWGDVLYYEDFTPDSPVIVVHFDGFVKADTWYQDPNDVKPSLWLQGSKALYDPKDILKEAFEASSSLVYKPTAEEVEKWRGKIFAYIHEAYRSVMRNETYDVIYNLDKFRWMVAYGWYMEIDERVDVSWGDWSKFEGERSHLQEWQLHLLNNWDSTRNHNEIMKTINSMLPEFYRLNKTLCQKTGLDEKREWCERIINLVL